MADNEQVLEATPEQIQEATDMGWQPKDEFPGDPEKWVGAVEYLERGKNLLPIVTATNKRLKGEVSALKGQLTEMQSVVRSNQETIAALETYHAEDVKKKVEQARIDLKAQLAAANREGNHEAVAELTDQMTQLNAAEESRKAELADEEAKRKAAPRQQDYTKHPDFIAWTQEKATWYGKDVVRTSIANGLTWKMREEGETAVGREFLDKVADRVDAEIAKLSGNPPRNPKVEGGGATGTRTTGGTKSYSDLPADAKAACDAFEKDLVGKNKPYKTREEWRKKYATDHFSSV